MLGRAVEWPREDATKGILLTARRRSLAATPSACPKEVSLELAACRIAAGLARDTRFVSRAAADAVGVCTCCLARCQMTIADRDFVGAPQLFRAPGYRHPQRHASSSNTTHRDDRTGETAKRLAARWCGRGLEKLTP